MHTCIELCLSSRRFLTGGFVRGFLSGRFCLGWFLFVPLLSEYIHYNRKLNITFNSYSPNTPHLVTSMLMMCRRSSMVHLLISSLLLAALMLSLKICTSGCLPIGYR